MTDLDAAKREWMHENAGTRFPPDDDLLRWWADQPANHLTAGFSLHGKTIKGGMQMGGVYALDFTDGTHLWITARDGELVGELRPGPL